MQDRDSILHSHRDLYLGQVISTNIYSSKSIFYKEEYQIMIRSNVL
ncbi:hypothetical protein SAMN05444412_101312 [Rhodonellum ikkaensis]|uniref:Uncharacterized protein n=1 Tax=Rhodonellum ikkaensis TaxID=336829 RepID=A0A1H3KA35_9BACT|nr:hypothetical protein SAMN05444412_101312 [Rhodonellum ikkaensis]